MTQVFCAMVVVYMVSGAAFAQSLTIASVGSGYMLQLRDWSSEFTEKNPDIDLQWIVLDVVPLRRWVAADIATMRGQYDIVTLNAYEVPVWAKEGWLVSLNDLPASYDVEDIPHSIRSGLSMDGNLYAVPFYGEGTTVMYRIDLMEKAGLAMPEAPTWDFIRKAAKAMTNKTDEDSEVYGICLRGRAAWDENMALLTAMANSFGAKWFDLDWNPQFDGEAWKETLNFYLDMMKESGPPEASSKGIAGNLTLFQEGKCGIWIDSSDVAVSAINPRYNEFHDQVGFALAPDTGLGKRANWLWTLNLAIPSSSKKIEAAKKFISWATSKDYLALLESRDGWLPPGTRTSLYENPEYADKPFAQPALESINFADPINPAVEPVPYIGAHFVAIPEYPSIANAVGEQFSKALAGQISAEAALENAQDLTVRIMEKAGYINN